MYIVVSIEPGYRGEEIAAFLGRDPAAVSRRLRERDRVRDEVAEVLGELTPEQKAGRASY